MDLAFSVLPYLLTEGTPYVVFAGAGYLAWRFVRAYERRAIAPDRFDTVSERVRVLEDAVDELESRADRSDDLQQFTSRVLAGHVANTRRQAGT
jgi:hypothetical protein